ncbi:MAG: hypothetical protein KI785_08460 [Devosiaceae bacterium]|nr:hypothetical protein [Devosiaceae bacterium MH13]
MSNRADGLRSRRDERRAYTVLYWLTFGLFVVAALIARLLPSSLNPLASSRAEGRSVLAEAQSAASATIGYAFMG